jgi:hypothetical protein
VVPKGELRSYGSTFNILRSSSNRRGGAGSSKALVEDLYKTKHLTDLDHGLCLTQDLNCCMREFTRSKKVRCVPSPATEGQGLW